MMDFDFDFDLFCVCAGYSLPGEGIKGCTSSCWLPLNVCAV